jgi:flagellin
MGLSLINNTAALNAGNSLNKTNSSLGKSLERLSSGLKINRGADGAAGLVISEKQRAQIAGLKTAIDNTNKAVSLVQTGEGALNEINGLLTKARSLALDSANSGVNDADSLAANQAELRNALDSITKIATNTQFGSKKLLDGSAGIRATTSAVGVSVSAGAGSSAAAGNYDLVVTTAAVKANAEGTAYAGAATFTNGATGTLTINNVDISLNESNAGTLDDAINTINSFSNQTGVKASVDAATGGNLVLSATKFGTQGDFTVDGDANGLAAAGFAAAVDTQAGTGGGVAGADATGTLELAGGTAVAFTAQGNVINSQGLKITVGEDPAAQFSSLTVATGTANINVENNTLTFQVGANAGQTANVGFRDVRASSLGQGASDQVASLNDIDVTTAEGAQAAIEVIDAAISEVSNLRGDIGAFQANTLETNANNLRVSLENTTAAESVIRDTDFASEIANFTKQQTLMQAGSTVLGNANQITSLVAGLLRG